MKAFSRCTIVLLIALAVCSARASAEDKIQWQNAAAFEIEGMGWTKTAGPFDRLPDSAKTKVGDTAWNQSKQSAGIAVRFTTDDAAVSVRWSLTSASLAMPHMPATGCSGLDLYARTTNGEWRFIGNCRPGKQDGNQSTIDFADGAKAKRECILYLPLYNGTKSLEIGVPTGGRIEKPAPRSEDRRKPVVVYGTSITQGGCASRPGLLWSSILGRMLDRPVINLGFSASGGMAPPVGEVLAEIDAAAYLIDCTWNMGTGKEMFLNHVTKLVQAIRTVHPRTPILFMGQSMIRPDAHPSERTLDQEFAVQSLQKEGVEGLLVVAPNDFIGDDGEGTVDGVHYTDIGMQRQAQALFPIVSKALNEAVTKVQALKPHVYIDTDMAAEVDDPYAVYRALVAPELSVVGLSSVGFEGPLDFATNTHASQKMNEEILSLLQLTDRVSHPLGAMHPMPGPTTPVDSPAARDMISKAEQMPSGQKLQVFVLGAFTNVASALLIEPALKDKVTIHIMGYRYEADGRLTTNESNAMGDLHAAAYLLKSGAELFVMPNSTLRKFQWAKSDVDTHFKGRPGVPDYLVKRWESVAPNDPQRTVWDIAVFEAFLRPQLATLTDIVHGGAKVRLWTAVDVSGMQADYWTATNSK